MAENGSESENGGEGNGNGSKRNEHETETNDNPAAIRSLAVSPEDVVDAYVYCQENPGEAVLRVTPPFHGRMRARLHVYRIDDTQLTGAVHVSPADILEDDVIATYPRLEDELEDAGEDELADVDEDETERIRKRHAESVEEWQERAAEAIVESVTLETDAGPHRVAVKRLG